MNELPHPAVVRKSAQGKVLLPGTGARRYGSDFSIRSAKNLAEEKSPDTPPARSLDLLFAHRKQYRTSLLITLRTGPVARIRRRCTDMPAKP